MKSHTLGMGEGTKKLRIRAVLGSWFAVVAVVAVLAVAAGGYATYVAHVSPEPVESTVEETAWSVDGSFDHAATVTRSNPVFETGTTLSNRTTYFVAASPVLDGEFAARYKGGDEPATIRLDADLVHRASDEETVYWSERTDLATVEEPRVSAGDEETVEFSFNVSRAIAHRENITTELGGTPGNLQTAVVVDVFASSRTNGEPAELEYSARLPVTVDGGAYTIGSPSGGGDEVTVTRAETRPREYGPVASIGGPLLLLVGLLGLAVVTGAWYRDEPIALTAEERAILEYRDQRAEFDEWVVRAELPEAILDRETARADSFADLVDFAIDTDGAVIEEPSREQYFVVTPDLLVAFAPPEPLEERD